ncbi:MAG TPA: serine/threonine protein kinase [Desulfobulbus sp.]|nr:serine/threonine protein kinase [Desulfobulbus sp.]
MNIHEPEQQGPFHALTPDRVLSLVEGALGRRCVNLCRPLNSYINRVYELEDEDGRGLIVKFYRPGRWSRQGLQDEHDFLLELADQEVPVIAPLSMRNGSTLGSDGHLFFTVFPKKGGRLVDEYSDGQWLELGRLIGRVHMVGAARSPADRPLLVPGQTTRAQVDYLVGGGFIPSDLIGSFSSLAARLIDETGPLFEDAELIRIHGDCHSANLIYRPDESFFLVDLDDMVVGPPVQDIWMLLPGEPEEASVELDIFLEGYETFRMFDRRSLRLIEPLRAMRFIHYAAWCARQVAEDGQAPVMMNFGTREYWEVEIRDLADQLERIVSMLRPSGNM